MKQFSREKNAPFIKRKLIKINKYDINTLDPSKIKKSIKRKNSRGTPAIPK
jgi:signal recognition particle receptor subunit beta